MSDYVHRAAAESYSVDYGQTWPSSPLGSYPAVEYYSELYAPQLVGHYPLATQLDSGRGPSERVYIPQSTHHLDQWPSTVPAASSLANPPSPLHPSPALTLVNPSFTPPIQSPSSDAAISAQPPSPTATAASNGNGNVDQDQIVYAGSGAWKCAICNKKLRRKQRALIHFMNKHGNVRLACNGMCGKGHCARSFATRESLDVHLNPMMTECQSCGKTLLKKNILRHQNQHCHALATK
ncbi:SubName: Full=Uncharacterized protein {ECO:0000313/EMBL:CCA70229.1} [Serendipita indica DSM 11827]|uniref:C2H2-type domain-containing protein n=1 Tax=Serendipita indica (strain DSM 11827) TaxID=1109443 RepID=G4TFY6_SERID|nr:SubName: Full=Uncharacterized protein {ECO:0000313/EMBL:CCA70229.1} [Serendipita indica DSM 11827]CCA70229.1 hypothetical protein PIIN_04168 [Serendipita indica DSM 11827]